MNSLRKKNQENNTIHHIIKNFKYPGTNLTEEVKDLYNENYKLLKKEINEDI
jgi:hypothetical protein